MACIFENFPQSQAITYRWFQQQCEIALEEIVTQKIRTLHVALIVGHLLETQIQADKTLIEGHVVARVN